MQVYTDLYIFAPHTPKGICATKLWQHHLYICTTNATTPSNSKLQLPTPDLSKPLTNSIDIHMKRHFSIWYKH